MINLGTVRLNFQSQVTTGGWLPVGVFPLGLEPVVPFNLLTSGVATMRDVAYWSAGPSGELSTVGAGPDGYRMRIEAHAANVFGYTRTRPGYAGVFYHGGIGMVAAVVGADCWVSLDFRDDAGTVLDSVTGAKVADGVEVRPTARGLAPVGTAEVSLVFHISGTAPGAVHFADGALLRPDGAA